MEDDFFSPCIALETTHILQYHERSCFVGQQIRNLHFSSMNMSILSEFHLVAENEKWKHNLLERLLLLFVLAAEKGQSGSSIIEAT